MENQWGLDINCHELVAKDEGRGWRQMEEGLQEQRDWNIKQKTEVWEEHGKDPALQ